MDSRKTFQTGGKVLSGRRKTSKTCDQRCKQAANNKRKGLVFALLDETARRSVPSMGNYNYFERIRNAQIARQY